MEQKRIRIQLSNYFSMRINCPEKKCTDNDIFNLENFDVNKFSRCIFKDPDLVEIRKQLVQITHPYTWWRNDCHFELDIQTILDDFIANEAYNAVVNHGQIEFGECNFNGIPYTGSKDLRTQEFIKDPNNYIGPLNVCVTIYLNKIVYYCFFMLEKYRHNIDSETLKMVFIDSALLHYLMTFIHETLHIEQVCPPAALKSKTLWDFYMEQPVYYYTSRIMEGLIKSDCLNPVLATVNGNPENLEPTIITEPVFVDNILYLNRYNPKNSNTTLAQ